MFKKILIVASLTLIASGLFAADDYEARAEIKNLRLGKVGFYPTTGAGVGVKTDAIVENTAANGVSVDGVKVKDNTIDANAATALTIGAATATSLTLGASDIDTAVAGILTPTLGIHSVAANTTANGVGAIGAGATSVIEQGDGLTHRTILTLTGIELAIANQAQVDSATMYTFPEGRILVEGVTANLVGVNTTNFNASTDDIFFLGVGTVAADAGDTLSGTEIDLIPLISNDTVDGTVTSFTNGTALALSAQFDGTSAAKVAILNMCIPQAADKGANTNTLTGSVTISWKNLGDY